MDKVERVACERETGQYFPNETDDKNNDQDQRVEEQSRAKGMRIDMAGETRNHNSQIFCGNFHGNYCTINIFVNKKERSE